MFYKPSSVVVACGAEPRRPGVVPAPEPFRGGPLRRLPARLHPDSMAIPFRHRASREAA